MIPVAEYTSSAEMLADAKARKARIYGPGAMLRAVERRHLTAERAEAAERARRQQERETAIIQADARHEAIRRAAIERMERERAEGRALLRQATPVKRLVAEFAEANGTTFEAITGASRCRELCQIRHQAVALVRSVHPEMSLPQIGRIFGGRDHTTILNSLRKAARLSTPSE